LRNGLVKHFKQRRASLIKSGASNKFGMINAIGLLSVEKIIFAVFPREKGERK